MWDAIYKNIGRHVSLTDEEKKIISLYFKPRQYRKKQYILQEGEICKHEYFILSGCTRTYEVDTKGQEHVLQFGIEDWWIGDLYSFLTGTPSRVNIDCIEDCKVLAITNPDLERLYKEAPAMERFFRIILQNAYVSLQKRILDTLSKPAIERYRDFLNRYPQIGQRIPDHQIASFLGITPQSLSRIRKKNV